MESISEWSDRVAGIAADSLIDHGLIEKDEFERAKAVIAEEIVVRLCADDYPLRPEGPK